MKKHDITLIIVVVFVSSIVSFFASKALFASPKNLKTKVEVVEPITAEFKQPDKRYFNANSLNPTAQIRIGPDKPQDPFQQQAN